MLAKLRCHVSYANVVATLALFVALSTGGAYAANTIFSSDIVDGEVKAPDIGTGAVGTDELAGGAVTSEKTRDGSLAGGDVLDNSLKGADIDESTLASIGGGGPAGGDLTGSYPNPRIAPDAVEGAEVVNSSLTGADVLASSLTGSDIAFASLTGSDVASDSLTGSDIFEASLNVRSMGCQIGVVQGFARVKGDVGMSSAYTASTSAIDTKNSCSGDPIEVRREAKGLYFVRFNGLDAKLALAISNGDGLPPHTFTHDNLISISRITGGADVGSFRVEVQDINSGGSDPEDNWFTIMVF